VAPGAIRKAAMPTGHGGRRRTEPIDLATHSNV
jgi:hypothetical protein